ncbi:hypothetical protein TNCV_626141 [Trichonephila clavipes]|nr:hypothetical protein TNCV_626141 [Trichonephila clavipes]
MGPGPVGPYHKTFLAPLRYTCRGLATPALYHETERTHLVRSEITTDERLFNIGQIKGHGNQWLWPWTCGRRLADSSPGDNEDPPSREADVRYIFRTWLWARYGSLERGLPAFEPRHFELRHQ